MRVGVSGVGRMVERVDGSKEEKRGRKPGREGGSVRGREGEGGREAGRLGGMEGERDQCRFKISRKVGVRCRAKWEHIRQSRSDSHLGMIRLIQHWLFGFPPRSIIRFSP